jgi:PIN domain nuclease of toxin-antitoxin system
VTVKLLLDTCTFLWLAGGGPMSTDAAAAIRDPQNDVFLSAVSVWEIVTKYRNGRLPLPEPPERLVPAERRLRGIAELPFDEASGLQGMRLPVLHRDPFDRMLIAQAIAHGLAIITPDPQITQYPVRAIW